jgi:starch synthase
VIAARFDAESLDGKATCKAALLEELGLPTKPDQPLIGMISRLVDQKGFDLIEAAAEQLLALPVRWVVLGSGAARYEGFLRATAERNRNRFVYRPGFDDPLAHKIEAGADFFLMPSRYEPSGLNQMMSMRYGTIPIVRETGGLADTVTPFGAGERAGGTGILFGRYAPEALLAALREAVGLYGEPANLLRARRNGMALDFSWASAARRVRAALPPGEFRATDGLGLQPVARDGGARRKSEVRPCRRRVGTARVPLTPVGRARMAVVAVATGERK